MRRTGATAALALALVTGCSTGAEPAPPAPAAAGESSAASCPAAPPADVGTPEGWLGWLAEHRDQVAVVLDDGRGGTVEHRAGEPQPLGSAAKVVHLAGYAAAVRDGLVRPDQPVRVGDWERFHLPGTDGGAHPAALQRLGVPTDGVRALDPEATVPLDAVVSAMVRESDNAAPDYLADLLGDDVLTAAAEAGGWPDAPVAAFLGPFLRLLDPALTDEEAAVRRYLEDPAEAARLQALPLPDLAEQAAWAATTASATAEDLAALHASLSAGDPPPAREQLEWQPPPEGYAGIGFKGGSLAGVLAEAFTVRRDDGSAGVGVLLVEGMSPDEWAGTLEAGLPHQQLLVGALTDPAAARQLGCALG